MLNRQRISHKIHSLRLTTQKNLLLSTREREYDILRSAIVERCVLYSDTHKIITLSGEEKLPGGWIIDFRNILLEPEPLSIIADLFWDIFEKEYPFQVGGQEVAAIPILSAIVQKSWLVNKPVSGFIIRKTRKEYGLQKQVEGTITNEKIILVDDLIHSGTSLLRQIKILKDTGRLVNHVFVLCAYNSPATYHFLHQHNIVLSSLFTLSDLGLSKAPNTAPLKN